MRRRRAPVRSGVCWRRVGRGLRRVSLIAAGRGCWRLRCGEGGTAGETRSLRHDHALPEGIESGRLGLQEPSWLCREEWLRLEGLLWLRLGRDAVRGRECTRETCRLGLHEWCTCDRWLRERLLRERAGHHHTLSLDEGVVGSLLLEMCC